MEENLISHVISKISAIPEIPRPSDPIKPVTPTNFDFEKGKRKYEKDTQKFKTTSPLTDPVERSKAEAGPWGGKWKDVKIAVIRSLASLDATLQGQLVKIEELRVAWNELHKKWEEQAEQYESSRETVENSVLPIFYAAIDNAKNAKVTAIAPELMKALDDFRAREVLMKKFETELNAIESAMSNHYESVLETLKDGELYIAKEAPKKTKESRQDVVRVITTLYGLTPGEADNIRIAALNKALNQAEAQSDKNSAFISEFKDMLREAEKEIATEFIQGKDPADRKRYIITTDEEAVRDMIEQKLTEPGFAQALLDEVQKNKGPEAPETSAKTELEKGLMQTDTKDPASQAPAAGSSNIESLTDVLNKELTDKQLHKLRKKQSLTINATKAINLERELENFRTRIDEMKNATETIERVIELQSIEVAPAKELVEANLNKGIEK